jgi:hypothetical protein
MKIELPQSYDAITVNQLQELYPIMIATGDLVERAYSRIAVLSGLPLDDVRKIKFKDIKRLSKGLEFLNEFGTIKYSNRYFFIDGHRYHWDGDFNNMIADQYTSFMDILKECDKNENLIIQNMHRLLACVVIKDIKKGKKWIEGEFDGDNFMEHQRLCKYKLPSSIGHPITVFFWAYFQKSIQSIQDYGSNQLTKAEKVIKEVEQDLLKHGVGMSHLTI